MLVCASSKVGAKMFAFARALVAADRIASFCIEALSALEPPLAKVQETQGSTAVMAEVTRHDFGDALAQRRNIKLQYKGMEVVLRGAA